MQTSKRQRDWSGSTAQPIASSSSGLRNSLHGNVFQLKLWMLFLIRGIGMSYRFELATEMPGNGGKFDDLVFRYRQIIVPEKGTTQEGYRYRFLQAKHKQDESLKITASQLLKGDEGDFSLSKYFRSFCCDVNRRRYKPTDVQDCILCTNIGIDEIDLKARDRIIASFAAYIWKRYFVLRKPVRRVKVSFVQVGINRKFTPGNASMVRCPFLSRKPRQSRRIW